MPPGGNNSPGASGVPASNLKGLDALTASVDRLEAALAKGGKTSTSTQKATDSLTKKLTKLDSEAKKSGDKVTILGRAITGLQRAEMSTTAATREMARSLSETAKVMTEEEAQASRSRVESIGQAASVASRDSRDFAILQKARRLGNLENFRDEMEKQAELAKAQQSSGNIFQRAAGLFNGGFAKMRSNGAAASEAIGGALGFSGEAMSSMALAAGGAAAIFMAFKAVLERTAASAVNASKAGAELDFSSYFGAIGSAAEFATRTTTMRTMSMYGVSEDALTSLLDTNNRYNSSLIASGGSYMNAIAGSEAYRNEVRLQTVDFVGAQAAVGTAMGLTTEESVELASKLSSASRSGIKPTQQAFMASAVEAKRLGLGIQAVINPTILWAEAIADSGEGAMVASRKTREVTSAVQALGEAQALGFKNLNPAQMAKFTDGFTKLMANMEPTRLAALTMQPGESFNSILGRVTEGGSAMYEGAIKNAMNMIGATKGQKISNEQALTLGSILGADASDLVGTQKIGRIAAATQDIGQVRGSMASQMDSKYNAAEGVGANLLRNNDMLGTMAAYMKGILDILIDWGSKLAFAKSDTAMKLSRDRGQSADTGAGKAYGNQGSRYRPALGT
jgi:hypothetical protein